MINKRPARTWLEVAVARAGLRTGIKAMTWAYQWAVAREALGEEPTVEQVAEYWNGTRRTAFREQAAFREAFPEFETPAKIYETEQARAAVRKHADTFANVEEWGERRRARKAEEGIAHLGGLPSNL